jgi:cation diffusion facilitator family transporter
MLAGTLSGSVSICADAFNNLGDAGSSIVTLFGFKAASRKPDSDHPFGHGRYEYISGFTVAIFIIFMGVEFVKSSFEKITSGTADSKLTSLTAAILLISVAVKVYI